MTDKFKEYEQARASIPPENRLWPLYGAGFENLGQDGKPISVETPEVGPDQLLVRHDACGLCFSDIKVLKAGETHPRIKRNMRTDPVVLGHEVSMTVVKVGDQLKDKYKVGDRFIIQADVYVNGENLAYGYMIQGGLSQYNVIDQRILNGDEGSYLLPVQPETGYAQSALTEPWACVIAAYQLEYRTTLKNGGTTWVIGAGKDLPYTIGTGFDEKSHPGCVLLTNVPPRFAGWLKERTENLGIQTIEVPDVSATPVDLVDDIILLGPEPDMIEKTSPHLANHGIFAIIADTPLPRKVIIDLGRVHYNRWVYVGGKGPDIARAYSDVPVRSKLKPGGKSWFVGAGGPMGRMHIQRAIEVAGNPSLIMCSDVSNLRLEDLCTSYASEAKEKGIEFVCLNPMEKDAYQVGLNKFQSEGGFDDIIVLAPVPSAIAEASAYLAPKGVMNVFAGLNRGTMVTLDLSDAYLKNTRIIGHSASTIDDLRLMLYQTESGRLSTNRSVAAIGSLSAVRDGLQSVLDTSFPGKVVIFPNIKEFPLTSLTDLKEKLPTVYARLKDGREWTVEAEREFLRLMLP